MNRCRVTVTWFELNLTVRCLLPEGHALPHSDGCWQWDAFGLRVPSSVETPRREPEDVAAEIVEEHEREAVAG